MATVLCCGYDLGIYVWFPVFNEQLPVFNEHPWRGGRGVYRDGNGSDSDQILQISVRNHIRGCYQYLSATVLAGRNLYLCSCSSDFGRVLDIRRI
jgi:hypothetical protein